MLGKIGLALLGAAAVATATAPAFAQFPPVTDPTSNEVRCQSTTAKVLTKEVGAIAKCAAKCFRGQRKLGGPYTDCIWPYGGSTAICINDPIKGPEAKAAAAIIKACAADCPECYADNTPNTCETGQPLVATAADLTIATGANVYCVEEGGGTPSAVEAKCEDAVAKNLTKWVAAINKCYDKCAKAEVAGRIAPDSCNPPNPADDRLVDCLDSARSKTIGGINGACFLPPGVAPSCYDGGMRPTSGFGWTSLVESIVNEQIPQVACGSPSGAFLQ
jgi:putative hemolysin